MKIPFYENLDGSQNILIAGAGGGFDIFCGLPLYFHLKSAGKTVHLANLSSGALGFCDAENPVLGLWRITSRTAATKYFPEMHLSAWLSQRYGETPIFAIAPGGARPVSAAYEWLTRTLQPDAIVLVDGGTDSLMRGDEAGLATPEGDAVSLMAVQKLQNIPQKLLVCLGFGIDAHGGVCHAHFLENVAALSREDAYLGAWSLLQASKEFQFYRDACDYALARLPQQPSIVNTSIIAAVTGAFGDVHSTKRTEGSKLFINPLMALFWGFRLEGVARRNLYLDRIRDTATAEEVALAIENFRDSLPEDPPVDINPVLNVPASRTILILEDNDDRIASFQKAVATLGDVFILKVWRDAPSMCAECEEYFPTAALISLDHDLNPMPGATVDPGTGMDASRFLADFLPVCPVLIHSSNIDRVYSMHNEFRFAGWPVDRVGPIGTDWIETSWVKRVREILQEYPNTWKAELPADHRLRFERVRLSLDGLGLGDALGEMLNYRSDTAQEWLAQNTLPAGPWFHTDDTEMAISISHVLKSHGHIHQDALAKRFARRFERDPDRGYGKMTRIQMREIIGGAKWRDTAANAFGGQGSMGNGGAMRVAPAGAYFADDLDCCVTEARASALVTHTHPEGVAGAIAVAVTAAMAWQLKDSPPADRPRRFFDEVLRLTPDSQVRRGILLASQTPPEVPTQQVAKTLGNGFLVTAPDTVPFCLWMAAHHSANFTKAIAKTIEAGGDCDTNAAIVGGIVALSVGRAGIPTDWLNAREPVSI